LFTSLNGYGNEKEASSMKKNMGTVDRVIRATLSVVIVILYFTGSISGTAAVVLGTFAVVLLLTSSTGVCPGYMPFGISTMEKKK
jgi:hypothetical protein